MVYIRLTTEIPRISQRFIRMLTLWHANTSCITGSLCGPVRRNFGVSLLLVWMNFWTSCRVAGGLRLYDTHVTPLYDLSKHQCTCYGFATNCHICNVGCDRWARFLALLPSHKWPPLQSLRHELRLAFILNVRSFRAMSPSREMQTYRNSPEDQDQMTSLRSRLLGLFNQGARCIS